MMKVINKLMMIAAALVFVGCSKSESNKADDANAKISRMNEIASILDSKQVKFTSTTMQMPNMTASEVDYVEKLLVEYINLGDQVLAVANDPDILFTDYDKMSSQVSLARSQLEIVRKYKGQNLARELSREDNDKKVQELMKEAQELTKALAAKANEEQTLLLYINAYADKEKRGHKLTRKDLETLKGHLEKRLRLNNEMYDLLGQSYAKFEEALRIAPQSATFNSSELISHLNSVLAVNKNARAEIQSLKEELLKNINSLNEALGKPSGLPVNLDMDSDSFLPVISA